jgi:hypothetical protein
VGQIHSEELQEAAVHLVTHLTPAALAAVRHVVGLATILDVAGIEELRGTIRTAPVDALVIDPGLIASDDAAWVSLLGCYSSLPLALYTGLSPGGARAIVALARVRAPYIILHDFESEGSRFAQFLAALPPASLDRQVLARIAGPLAILPHDLAVAVRLLFADANPAHTVDWLASSSSRSRRWVERHVTHAGFTSAARLVMSPWLLRAYHYLRDKAFTQRDVARKVGVSSSRTLLQELALLGVRSRDEVAQKSPDEVVDTVVRIVYRGSRAA